MKNSGKKRFIIIVLLMVMIAVGVVLTVYFGKKENEPVVETENEPVVEYNEMVIRCYTLYDICSEDYIESAYTYEDLLTYVDEGRVVIGSNRGYYAFFYDTEYDYEIPSEEIKQLCEEKADEMDQIFLDNAEEFNNVIAQSTADFSMDPPCCKVDVTEYYPEEIIFTIDGVEFTFYVEKVTFDYHYTLGYYVDEAYIEENLSGFKTPSPKLCKWKCIDDDGVEWHTYVGGSGYIIDIEGKYVITDTNEELVKKYVEQTSTEDVSEE